MMTMLAVETADANAAMPMKLRSIAGGAAQRARKRGLPVDPDLVALTLNLYEAQGARCALN
jgi:hypothetical protein